MSAYNPNDPYDMRPRPGGSDEPEIDQPDDLDADADDVLGDDSPADSPTAEAHDPAVSPEPVSEMAQNPEELPLSDGAPEEIALHPMTSEQPAEPARAVVVVPPTAEELADDPWARPAPAYRASEVVEAYDPYAAPERRGVPVWALVIAVVLALAAGAAAGLMFPQVRGATNAEVQDAKEAALLNQGEADKAQNQIDELEAEKATLTEQNQTLTAERDKLGQTARTAQQDQTQLAAAEKLLGSSTAKLHESVEALKAAVDAPGVNIIPQTNAFASQAAVSSAAMTEQLARLSPLAATERRDGVALVDGAINEADTLIDQATSALLQCTDRPCRIAAVDGLSGQLVAIDQKLEADVSALLTKAPKVPAADPNADTNTGSGASDENTGDGGASDTMLEGSGEQPADGTVGGDTVAGE